MTNKENYIPLSNIDYQLQFQIPFRSMNTAKNVIHRLLDMHAYLTKGTEYKLFPYRGNITVVTAAISNRNITSSSRN